MNEAVPGHRLVRDYLRKLDSAARILPSAKAGELRQQIIGHLADAIAPDAGDADVAAVLSRLGVPADLVNEAIPAQRVTALRVPDMARVLIARLSRRTWLITGLVIALFATGGSIGVSYADRYRSAPDLEWSGGGDWWYQQDFAREVITRASLLPGNRLPVPMTENRTPLRCGQRQGYVISLYNASGVTQTITADASGPHTGWNNPGSATEQIAVSTTSGSTANGAWGGGIKVHFVPPPAGIPPFQSRLVRVLWTTAVEGGSIDHLLLRVRVGWLTRTEAIPQQTWGLILPGNTSYAQCTEDPAARPYAATPAGSH